MHFLDTDTLALLMKGHTRVSARVERTERVAITIVSRIELLQGRFASLLKAADGQQLLLAQHWLDENEQDLNRLIIVPFDAAAAAQFDTLRRHKKLRKIGRADLLIACIALAHKATVVTRNAKDFQQVPGLQVENWADGQ
jgi:tRNA(fMet)-specific endonuclease VapC